MKNQVMGSVEESAIDQRPGQGCVEPSRGLEGPNLPLSPPLVCSSLLHLRSSWKGALRSWTSALRSSENSDKSAARGPTSRVHSNYERSVLTSPGRASAYCCGFR